MRLIGGLGADTVRGAELERLAQELCHGQLSVLHRVNERVAKLHSLGLFRESLVLGPVVLERPHRGLGEQESHEIVQAALSSEFGLVAAYWDSDEYTLAHLEPTRALIDIANSKLMMLEDAEPIVRALVCRHAHYMLERLVKSVVIHLDLAVHTAVVTSSN